MSVQGTYCSPGPMGDTTHRPTGGVVCGNGKITVCSREREITVCRLRKECGALGLKEEDGG